MRSEVEDIRLRNCLTDLHEAHRLLARPRFMGRPMARMLITQCIQRIQRSLASADTHAERGDAKQAPSERMGSAVPNEDSGDAQ